VTLVSPTNHFLFTPLLPSTAVGTLEFRAIQEPVRTIPGIHYHQAKAREIDVEKGVLLCEDIFKFRQFELPFDKLVIATGVKTNTFNTPGILEMENRQVCQCHVTGRFFFVGCREDDIEAAP
jgi:NADH dehydrogenase FAD-containing subunit